MVMNNSSTAWNTSAPQDDEHLSRYPVETRVLRQAVASVFQGEHHAVASANATTHSRHRLGSARVYVGDFSVSWPATALSGKAFPVEVDTSKVATCEVGRLAIGTHNNNELRGFLPVSAATAGWAALAVGGLVANAQLFGTLNAGGKAITGLKTGTAASNATRLGQFMNTYFAKAAGVVTLNLSGTQFQTAGDKVSLKAGGISATEMAAGASFRYSGSVVFNTTCSAANKWQNLDLSSIVGSNRSLVLLKVVGSGDIGYAISTGESAGGAIQFHSGYIGPNNAHLVNANDAAFFVMMTDSSGVLSHGCTSSSLALTITLLGYIK